MSTVNFVGVKCYSQYIVNDWDYTDMALPHLIEPNEKDWIFKVTEETSLQPIRDVCLLAYFLAAPCTTLEINRIQIRDVLHKSGKLNKKFTIRGTTSYNGDDRVIFLKNKRLVEFTKSYIQYRIKNNIGMGNHPDHYLGLDPDEPLFFTNKGTGFSIVSKKTDKGSPTYSCDALNRHLKALMGKAGIECPSVLSGRRTFAVTLKRKGYDVAHIHHLLGNKSLTTTTKLLTTDPVDMGAIAAEAF